MSVPTNVLIEYTMTGQLLNGTGPNAYEPVYWTVYNTPDMTGEFSGYVGSLQNIYVAASVFVSAPIDGYCCNQTPLPPVPPPADPTVLLQYTMTGQLLNGQGPNAYEPVYWDVFNTPDLTGAFSGYFGELQNIQVSAIVQISSSTSAVVVPTSPAGGDLSGFYPNPKVVGLQTNPILAQTLGVAQDGYVLTWSGTNWQAAPGGGGGGGGIIWDDDLLGSTSTAQYITSLSGFEGLGGVVTINANPLSFGSLINSPLINQTALANVSGTGAAGQKLTISAQKGQGSSSLGGHGGAGGDLALYAGFGGSGTTVGTRGTLHLGSGATDYIQISPISGVILPNNLSATYLWTNASGVLETGTAALVVQGAAAGGDLSGTYLNPTVSGIYNNPVASTSPVNHAVPVWDTAIYDIRPLTMDDILPGFTIESFSGGSTVEIGATVTNPTFSASYSALPVSANIINTDSIDSPLTLVTPFTSGTVVGSFHHTSAATVSFTLTAVGTSTKTAGQSINFQARSFAGVGSAGATNVVTSSAGSTATLSTGDVLSNEGLSSSPVGQTYGPFTPLNQKLYVLLVGGSHVLKDPATNTIIPITSSGPTAVSFTNQNSAVVSMYLYESRFLLAEPFSILVSS